MPRAAADRILASLQRETARDGFDTLYHLLHGPHEWVPDLEREIEQRQLRIKLRSGQGYLLHDGSWLHGREAPKDGVTADRLHRLVFAMQLRNGRSEDLPRGLPRFEP